MPKSPVSPPGSVSSLEQLRLSKLHQLRSLQRLKAERDAQAAQAWLEDPAGWAEKHIDLGGGLAGYQRQAMTTLAKEHRLALRKPHGAGGTATAGLVVLWFAITREATGKTWKVITTASAWRQLSLYLWPEIHHWASKLRWDLLGRGPFHPRKELTTLQLRGLHGLAAAVASDDPSLIEGAHAEEILYIFDEAKAIPAGVWDAAEGALSTGNSYALALSTPGAPAGRFYEIHARRRGFEDWAVMHVTLEQALAAGRIKPDWASQRAEQWGETSSIYTNRVLGEFHAGDEDVVIPLAWAEAAVERWHAWNDAGRPDLGGQRLVGVDVARSGADKTVRAHRHGPVVVSLDYTVRQDTMQTTAKVQADLAAGAELAVVDTAGIGAGVTDRLRELNSPVLAYVGAAKTTATDRSNTWGFTNCLVGDARARPIGDLVRIYRSSYKGPLYEIKTARGDHFTATANHQVLTPRGLISVQSLRVGDQLCNADVGNPASGAAHARPEIHHMPPQVGEVYRAAYNLFGSERVKADTVNFHGDRPMGEVDIVTVDRQLLMIDPPDRKTFEDIQLICSLVGSGALLGLSPLPQPFGVAHLGDRVRAPLPYRDRQSDPLLALSKRASLANEIVSFGHSAPGDAAVPKDATDDVSICALDAT